MDESLFFFYVGFLISKKLSKKLKKKAVESRLKSNKYTWGIIKSKSFVYVKMEEREDR